MWCAGHVAIVVLATLGLGVMDLMLPSAWAMCMSIGGSYGGTATGIMNTAGNLGWLGWGYRVWLHRGSYGRLQPAAAVDCVDGADCGGSFFPCGLHGWASFRGFSRVCCVEFVSGEEYVRHCERARRNPVLRSVRLSTPIPDCGRSDRRSGRDIVVRRARLRQTK